MAARITVDILTGFLGSGKTTLLNRLLAEGGFANTAVVVNELGEIGLDHLLVTERTDQIALLEGGCLCCAVVDSLPETLLELCRKRSAGDVPPFDRIVIETTGLADPGPIYTVISRSPLLGHFMVPGVVVTAFDALDGFASLDRHPEAVAQLVLADRIVVTKLDMRAALTEKDRARLSALNPLAEIIGAGEIVANPGLLVKRAPVIDPKMPTPAARHTHGVVAHSFLIEKEVTHSGLAAWSSVMVHNLGRSLLRCKGFVRIRNRVVVIQGVGARFAFEDAPASVELGQPSITCIVQNQSRDVIEALLPWLSVAEGTLPPLLETIA